MTKWIPDQVRNDTALNGNLSQFN